MAHTLNMITLGVRDKGRARAFYDALGWGGTGGEGEDPIFFCSHGTVVSSCTENGVSFWDGSPIRISVACQYQRAMVH